MSPSSPGSRIALSGAFAALVEGRRVTFARRGAERLLAYLALNGASARPRIAEALWPEASREHGLTNLRQALRAVAAAGCADWVRAEGTSLRLAEGVVCERGEETLLASWDDRWIDAHRQPARTASVDRAADALFDLLDWQRDRSPEAALRIAIESEPLLSVAPAARLVAGMAPILGRVERLPVDAGEVCTVVARAHYLVGQTDPAFALYGRIVGELAPSEAAHHARLSQVVLLRESGATREASRRAEAFAAAPPSGSYFRWVSLYHQGYARYQAYGRAEDLDAARRAVEADPGDGAPLNRLFPALNVAEALIDAGRIDAGRVLLDEARRLARQAGDPLSLMTARMHDLSLLAQEGSPEVALAGFADLEAQATRARLTPFAALVLDRAAMLASVLGRPREARERLARSEGMRRGLGVRRTPVERARLAALGV